MKKEHRNISKVKGWLEKLVLRTKEIVTTKVELSIYDRKRIDQTEQEIRKVVSEEILLKVINNKYIT